MATDEGISLVRLIHDRYGNTDDEPQHIQVVVSRALHAPAPGEGDLVVPHCLGLNDQKVSSLGDLTELRTLCADVTDLDIAANRLTDWTQVLLLLHAMPRLQFLNIGHNPLSARPFGCLSDCLSAFTADNCRPANPALSCLILNGSGASWADVWTLLDLLPSVAELHVARNALMCTVLPPSGVVYPGVRHLYANDNSITEWGEVIKLGRTFPRLERLVLMGNPVKELSADQDVCREMFPVIRHLNISNSLVNDWAQLQTLRLWPSLTELRVQNIPLLESYDPESRLQLTMAYLPTISQINGSPVTKDDRDSAERAFIRRYMDQEQKPRRYHELHELHGDLDPLAEVNLDPKTTVNVAVSFDDKSSIHSFDVRITLKELKKELGKILEVSPKSIQVWYRDMASNYGDEIMRYEERTLLRYRVNDGDELDVHLNAP